MTQTPEQNERASLANEARLDAKAFRENTVYDSEGDPIRLIANANRLDQYAYRIEALEAEIERLRATLRKIAMPIELEGFSDWQRMNAAVEYIQFNIDLARSALKDTRHDADA